MARPAYSADERERIETEIRQAALRFWLSRLYDKTFPPSGELTFIKCPDQLRDMHRLRSIKANLPDSLSAGLEWD